MNTEKFTTPDTNIGGVKLVSRYGRQYEADQMASFIVVLGSKVPLSMAHLEMVFYDSQSQSVTFKFKNGKDSFNDAPWTFLQPVVEQAIFEAAKATINQFEWNGFTEHGFRYTK